MGIKESYFVQPVVRAEYAEWLLKKHYAHRMPSVMFAFGIYDCATMTLQGVCTFGMPPCQMNNGSGIFAEYSVSTYELTRLVTTDNHPRNMTSFFVSQCLSRMQRPSCIVSFADPNNHHHGYIYQATNWLYTGLTQKGGKDKQWILNGREYHGKTITIKSMKDLGMDYDHTRNMACNWRANGGTIEENALRKFRYIYLNGSRKERRTMTETLILPVKPYPKGPNIRYDASHEPERQALLF